MLDSIFTGIFDSATTSAIAIDSFIACIGAAIIIGIVSALFYTYKNKYTKSFLITLALLPAIISAIIMMVNGNIGAGVAVAGAFSLIRFRSVPGTAKEIGAIFIAMAAGLMLGMGYIGYAALFVIIVGAVGVILTELKFGEKETPAFEKILRITIPEDLDYAGVFDDLFNEYTVKHQLANVKTTNMGSMFKLTYNISLRDTEKEKELIDKLRCRNGNLEISSSMQETRISEL